MASAVDHMRMSLSETVHAHHQSPSPCKPRHESHEILLTFMSLKLPGLPRQHIASSLASLVSPACFEICCRLECEMVIRIEKTKTINPKHQEAAR